MNVELAAPGTAPGFVWDQTMLLHQMAIDSDLLGQEMCSKWRKGEDVSRDFHWAQHFRVVPQHVQHSVTSMQPLGYLGVQLILDSLR